MMCIRGEADIQHTPANITSLHCSLQVEACSGGIIQSDVLVLIIPQKKNHYCQNKVLSAKTQRR